jgi:hypothetical protein
METRERELMAAAEQESQAYEREIKFQIEEKERRDYEQASIDFMESQYQKRTQQWRKLLHDQDEVRTNFEKLTLHSGKTLLLQTRRLILCWKKS